MNRNSWISIEFVLFYLYLTWWCGKGQTIATLWSTICVAGWRRWRTNKLIKQTDTVTWNKEVPISRSEWIEFTQWGKGNGIKTPDLDQKNKCCLDRCRRTDGRPPQVQHTHLPTRAGHTLCPIIWSDVDFKDLNLNFKGKIISVPPVLNTRLQLWLIRTDAACLRSSWPWAKENERWGSKQKNYADDCCISSQLCIFISLWAVCWCLPCEG